jgi:hypothetical protein
MNFVRNLSGIQYLLLLLITSTVIDLLATLHYRALSLGLIRQTVIFSVAINVLATITAAWVILSFTLWPLFFETIGVGIGTWVGMKMKFKPKRARRKHGKRR